LAASPEALSGYSIIEWYLGDTPSLVGQGAGFDLLAEDVGKTLRVRAVPVAADGTVYTSIWKDLGSVRVGATASQGASITRDRVVVDYRQDPQIAFPVEVFGGEPLVVSLPSSDHLTAREVSRVVSEEIRAGLTEQSIKSVLGALDMLYVNAGLSGARALLRPQDTSQGLLEIALLEPRIGQVLFVGTRRAAIAQALTPQVIGRSGEPLDLGRVDAGLAATNESSRHRYRAVLREGREFGQSDLVVAVSEASLTDISLGANNLGARETGRSLSSARFALYPEVGLLDGVSASAVKAEGLRLTSGGADLKLPLPGATLGVVHTEIETKYIMGPAAQLDASGRSKSDTYRLSMPIYRQAPWVIDGEFVHGRDKNGTAYLGQLIQSNTKAEKNQFAVTVRRSSIPLSSAKLGLQASASVSRGRHVTYGVDDLETRVKSLRRAYALSATVDFPQGYLLQARFDYARLAASDPDSAPGSEKYVVGSDKSRGYDQGQAIGDQGLAFSIELSGKYSPVSFTDRDEPDFLWRPRIFYDAAAARSYAALTPDQKSVRGKRFRPYRDEVYSSLGLGMQLQTAKGLLRSGALDGYIAIPLDDSVSGRARSARVGFSVSTLF
jgi:hemolysin activation/secretion protein